MKQTIHCFCLLLIMSLLNGCEYKELCIEHPHLVPVRVDAVWDKFGEKPMGMTVIFFP